MASQGSKTRSKSGSSNGRSSSQLCRSPPGIMLGPNTRAWRRSWIEEWLANRPTENRDAGKRQRGGGHDHLRDATRGLA